jgi:hypothetical protein
MNWAATEFEHIDLGDPRRNRRAIRLVERLSHFITHNFSYPRQVYDLMGF